MSGTQNICIDIFSQMSNLLSNFNANMLGSGGFSSDAGFVQNTMGMSLSGTEAPASSFEDSLNDFASMALIGVMALFLILAQVNTYVENQKAGVKGRRQNYHDEHFGDSSGPGSAY